MVKIKSLDIVIDRAICQMFLVDDVSALFQLKHEKQMKEHIKQNFACVQHEMKNCLVFILQFVDLLISGCTVQQLNLLENVKQATKLLLFTVSDWLDNTQLENASFQPYFSSFKIVEAVEEITSLVKASLDSKRLKLNVVGVLELPSMLNTDRSRFQQVLLNLLTNAIKYAPI